MLKRTMIVALVPALLLVVSPAFAGDENWTVDFKAAKRLAKETNKDIFMEFTGSDWCPPCKALYANILSKEEFLKEAPNYFILLKLDNPKQPENVAKQSQEERDQYQELSKKYGVRGVPTVFLADSTGLPYAQMVGFGGGTPVEYVENLKKMQQLRVVRDENFKKAESAEGVEKAKLLDAGVSGIDAVVLATFYQDQVNQIIALDADGQAGLKGVYETVLRAKEIDQQIDMATRLGPAAAVEKIDEIINAHELPKSLKQKAIAYKGFLLAQNDKGQALKFLNEAIEVAPESAFAAQIKGAISQIQAQE